MDILTISIWIGIVAGGVTILWALLDVKRIIPGKLVFHKMQNYRYPVKKHLSWLEVIDGLERMSLEVKAYDPDLIIGINRGGALVGGFVSKQLATYNFIAINYLDDKEHCGDPLIKPFKPSIKSVAQKPILSDY